MSFYDSADAIFGTGQFGSASYGVVAPTVSLAGVSATGIIRTIHLNVFEVDITEPLYNAEAGTGSIGTIKPNIKTSVSSVAATTSVGTTVEHVSAVLTSALAVGTAGSVGVGATQALQGVSSSVSIGTGTETSVSAGLTGVSATASAGSLVVGASEELGGLNLVTSVGSVRTNLAKTLASVVGTSGSISVNASSTKRVSVSGIALTASLGDLKGSTSEPTQSVSATVSVGSVRVHITEIVPGLTLTSNVGTVSASAYMFDYEAVKNRYSRRRTVILPRAA